MTDEPTPMSEHLDRVIAAAHRKAERAGQRPGLTVPDIAAATEAAEAAVRRAIQGAWAVQVPNKYVDASTADFEGKAAQAIERWQAAWHDGVNLVLSGPVGTGKTHAAFAAVREPFTAGARFAFWPELELRNALDWNNPTNRSVMDAVSSVAVLVLDDLGIAATNDWWAGQIDVIVNRRWLDDLPTVITTNLGREQLVEVLGERSISRLADHAVQLRLTGADRRRA